MLKTLSYVTSFGLLGAIGFIGYDYNENGKHASYFDLERAGTVLNGVRPSKPPRRAALDYTADIKPAIVHFDWTGKPPVIVKPDEGVDTESLAAVVVRVSEVLEVIMLIAEPENPGDSMCLVGFKDPSVLPQELLLMVGDTLPPPNDSVGVLRILGDHVAFSFADEAREPEMVGISYRVADVIVLVDDPSNVRGRTLIGGPGGGSGSSRTAPRQTELRNGQYYIGSEDAALFRDNIGEIFSRDVKAETYFDKDGKRAGIKLTDVRAGSIAERNGAQSGDVVIAINGSSVNSKQEAIQFVKNNSDRYDVWEVQVMNLGRVRTEIYHSPE